MENTNEVNSPMLGVLSEPFPARDIEWRVQSSGMRGDTPWARVLAYVTARAVQDRLDLACGKGGWRNRFFAAPQGGVMCAIEIKIGSEWVSKEDGADNTDIEAVKGGLSGAMKRAAVQWGIGRYLYRLDTGWADFREDGANSVKIDNRWYNWEPPLLPAWALPSVDADPDQGTPAPERREVPQAAKRPQEARPQARAVGQSWRGFPVPKFIKKYAGLNLGEMEPRDLEWWAANYTPKPYKGRISPADIEFRKALDEARADSEGGVQESSPEAPETSQPDEDVPF